MTNNKQPKEFEVSAPDMINELRDDSEATTETTSLNNKPMEFKEAFKFENAQGSLELFSSKYNLEAISKIALDFFKEISKLDSPVKNKLIGYIN